MHSLAVYAFFIHRLEQAQSAPAKAARYEIPFSYSFGEEFPAEMTVYEKDSVSSTIYPIGNHTVAAVSVEVDCESFIKANGWTVRAHIEHGDKGNIVTSVSKQPILPEWFTDAPHCDHCRSNRVRKVTYFVEHESGEIRQVGRACLKEYTGINPAAAAAWAELYDVINTGLDRDRAAWEQIRGHEMYAVSTVLAHAYDAIKEFGYRKSDEPGSTRDEARARVLSKKDPSSEADAAAEQINTWLIDLEQVAKAENDAWIAALEEAEANADEYGIPATVKKTPHTVSDLERNCINLALAGYALPKHFGRLAYMPVAYEKYLARKARQEQRAADLKAIAETSEYVGAVGQRLTVNMATAELITSWDTTYGTTFLYKFIDEHGNVYIWYASLPITVQNGMILKGTVKDHNEKDGVKQTIITRCKVLEMPKRP